MFKNHRDLLAILLGVLVLPGIWVANGFGVVNIPEMVLGTTVAIETLIVQFYFRKKEGETAS